MVEFKVVAFRKMDVDQGLLAFVDVEFFGVLIVRNFRIIRARDRRKIFCCLPVQSFYSQEFGKVDRKTVIKMPEELKAKVYAEILERWNEIEELKFKNAEVERSESR